MNIINLTHFSYWCPFCSCNLNLYTPISPCSTEYSIDQSHYCRLSLLWLARSISIASYLPHQLVTSLVCISQLYVLPCQSCNFLNTHYSDKGQRERLRSVRLFFLHFYVQIFCCIVRNAQKLSLQLQSEKAKKCICNNSSFNFDGKKI